MQRPLRRARRRYRGVGVVGVESCEKKRRVVEKRRREAREGLRGGELVFFWFIEG